MTDTVHLMSATTYTDGTRAAMCGERLEAEEVRKHPYANYTSIGSPSWHAVTCNACITAIRELRYGK